MEEKERAAIYVIMKVYIDIAKEKKNGASIILVESVFDVVITNALKRLSSIIVTLHKKTLDSLDIRNGALSD